ncbi:MAG: hypothetical protein J6W51_10190 [Fibrobacter sp.]|nr:hypothetical protein [Fibrobacter sp.]
MTAFFWNSCDNSSTPTAPQVTPNSSSGTNIEPTSSSATNTPVSSSAVENATPSSSEQKPASSAVAPNPSSSSVTAKSSSAVVASSSSVKEKVSSSSLDQNADLYGCPPDVCGAELSSSAGMIIAPKYGVPMSSSSKGMIAPKYGVPVMSSSSQGFEAVPLYGVVSNVCVKAENDSTLSCNGGVTCVESVTEKSQFPSCSGDQICAKYGVVIIKDKIYKCSDGKVYNEAEFKARYDMLTFVSKPEEKIPCYKRGDYVECDDGQSFSIDTDEKGNRTYSNEFYRDLSEKEFLDKYEILNFDEPIAVYGPPCMFNGTCDEEK